MSTRPLPIRNETPTVKLLGYSSPRVGIFIRTDIPDQTLEEVSNPEPEYRKLEKKNKRQNLKTLHGAKAYKNRL